MGLECPLHKYSETKAKFYLTGTHVSVRYGGELFDLPPDVLLKLIWDELYLLDERQCMIKLGILKLKKIEINPNVFQVHMIWDKILYVQIFMLLRNKDLSRGRLGGSVG